MKLISKYLFLVVAVFSILVFIFSMTGLRSTYGDRITNIINGVHMVPRGFGLENEVTLYLQLDSNSDVELNFSELKDVIEKRLEYSTAIEWEVYPDYSNNGFCIVIPFDSEIIGNLSLLGQMIVNEGLFELREGYEVDEDGNPAGVTENVVLTNKHIDYVRPVNSSSTLQGSVYYLEIVLNREGRKVLTEKTKQMIAESGDEDFQDFYLSVWINGELQDYYSAYSLEDAKVLTSFSNTNAGYTIEDVTIISIAMTGGHLNVPLGLYDIVADHNSSFAGDNTPFLMIAAFVLALIITGVILIARYKGIGAAGFVSMLGMFGIMFLFLTNFYGNPTKMHINTSTFGAFLVMLLFASSLIIRDAESVFALIKSGMAQSKAFGTVFENNLTPSVVGYSAVAITGVFIMDLFKRTGGIAIGIIRFIFPYISNRRFALIESLGRFMVIGGIFGAIIMIIVYRLLVRSAYSLEIFKTLNLPKKFDPKDYSVSQKRIIYILVVAIVIAAGTFLSLSVGFGKSLQNEGGYILTARITPGYTFDEISREEVYSSILNYFEEGSYIKEGEYAGYYYEIITVVSPTEINLDIDDFYFSINEEYEELLQGDCVHIYNLQKSFSFEDINTFLALFVVMLILAFGLVFATMGLKSSIISTLGLVVNMLLTLSGIVFIRVQAASVIFSTIAVATFVGFAFTIYNLSVLNNSISKSRKTNRRSLLDDAINRTVSSSCIYSVIVTLVVAGFVIIGLIQKANITWYFYCAMVFLSLLLPQYYSTFVLPGLYNLFE